MRFLLPIALSLLACGSSENPVADAGSVPDTPALDAPRADDAALDGNDATAEAAVDAADPSALCGSAFGNALTASFGRLDGVVRAVVRPSDTHCPGVNSDHVVLEVAMSGATYRMVVNILSTRADVDPRVRFAEVHHALFAPAWSEGWHTTGVVLDYPSMLGARTEDFAPASFDELSGTIARRVSVGARVSVFGTSGAGRPDSTHLIHRNGGGADGAIVLDPESSAPRFLIFHFDGQTF